MFDRVGEADLYWAEPETDVDVEWVDTSGNVVWTWEGYFLSYEYGEADVGGQLVITCNGAMRELDNFQAKPEYLYQPLPYEVAILRQFNRLTRMQVPDPHSTVFPAGWDVRFDPSKYPASTPWVTPNGLQAGVLWSGMLTRETGHFEPVLSSYVQGLLSNMWTASGQFTLLLDPGRLPVLRHRTHANAPDDTTLLVDLLWPGVKLSASKDFSQRVGVVYASGKSASGDTYSGMQVAIDGSRTWYEPMAYRRQLYPDDPQVNPWRETRRMTKEVNLSFSDGLTAEEATRASQGYLSRFCDPGVTGQLILDTDPIVGGQTFPRQAIRAGMTVWVAGLFGSGMLLHITESSVDHAGTQTLTLDSLFRDQLTVDQVRRRGRDALVPYRMLSTSGLYNPRIPDLLFPWSYAKGAGVMPFNGADLFTKLGPTALPVASAASWDSVEFPWTPFTKAFPPRTNEGLYIKVPPANKLDADLNWAWHGTMAYQVMLAAAGTIKLMQFAAYDGDGNVKQVPFHLSLYTVNGVNVAAMPQIPVDTWNLKATGATVSSVNGSTVGALNNLPRGHGLNIGDVLRLTSSLAAVGPQGLEVVVTGVNATSALFAFYATASVTASARCRVEQAWSDPINNGMPYPAGQHYPFFPGAWEKILPNGQTPTNSQQVVPSVGTSLLAGWGTFFELAGYWPGAGGSFEDRGSPTGLLVDESPISFDFTNIPNGVSIYDTPATNQASPNRVMAYLMVYCDADPYEPTYFLGRMFRQELIAT
jgi:hypothetical protein